MRKKTNTTYWKAGISNDTGHCVIRKTLFIISVVTILIGVVALPNVYAENKTSENSQETGMLSGGQHKNVACTFQIIIRSSCRLTWFPILLMPKTFIRGSVNDGPGLDFTVESLGAWGYKYTEYYHGGSISLVRVRGLVLVEYGYDANGGSISGTAISLETNGPAN
jgi:hypothetical protein